MYRKILVALDTTTSDQELIQPIVRLAALLKSVLVLLNVADANCVCHWISKATGVPWESAAERPQKPAKAGIWRISTPPRSATEFDAPCLIQWHARRNEVTMAS